jgi:Tol biopolymer transport system component
MDLGSDRIRATLTMGLSPGTKLASYEILSLAGEGGMGEVYRARDTRLGRDVAIKTLPATLARDAERLARFEREARLLAALNHPGIATLYGVEEHDETPYLVMELVEGETLAERIGRGPLAVDDTLALFGRIAEALEAAHEKGIIHRDLKPANIKITPEGQVKVLDFGLAKALVETDAPSDLSQSPTFALEGTQAGMILGTAPYMSPEQARGKAVDRRTDIWAFGCVLFEALCGKKAFDGETVTDVFADIVKNEPAWERLPSTTPWRVRELLQRCLRKDPRHRLREIGDARLALEDAAVEPEPRTAPGERGPRRLPAYAAFALAGALVSGVAVWALTRPGPAAVKRLAIQLPPIDFLIRGPGSPVVISPDGRSLVCLGMRNGRDQLYLRRLDRLEATPIEHTEGARHPFFSPDGAWLGFYARGALHKVSVDGGLPVKIVDLPPGPAGPPGEASWGDDGFIYYVPTTTSPVFRVPAEGGTPEAVTRLDKEAGEVGHFWPEALPGGRGLLFTVWSGALQTAQVAAQAPGSEGHVLLTPGTQPRLAGADNIVFCQGNALYAARLDTDRMTLRGPPIPVVEAVEVNPSGAAQYTISPRGTLVYVPAQQSVFEGRLAWVDRGGKVMANALTGIASDTTSFRLSPDGKRVVVAFGLPREMWVYHLSGQPPVPLAQGLQPSEPIWDPTGHDIAFTTPTPYSLYRVKADGSSAPVLLAEDLNATPWNWTPDGREILVQAYRKGGSDILAIAADGSREPREVLATDHNEGEPALSPDGRWLAYVSDLTGQGEVWVRAWDGSGAPVRVSREGGQEPQWGPRGRELYFQRLSAIDEPTLFSVALTSGDSLRLSAPRELFSSPFVYLGAPSYAVGADGRFLMGGSGRYLGASQAVVVLDWFSELDRLLAKR